MLLKHLIVKLKKHAVYIIIEAALSQIDAHIFGIMEVENFNGGAILDFGGSFDQPPPF
jgi:hypothetical protein